VPLSKYYKGDGPQVMSSMQKRYGAKKGKQVLVPQIDEAALRRLKETDPEKYQRALELTAKLPEIAERNPLTNFHPHPKQSVFLGSQDPIKAFLGGNRSGRPPPASWTT
jgi:hypothetical protein